jgi:hypothetical protein
MQIFCCYCHQPLSSNEEPCYGLHNRCFKEWFGLREDCKFLDLIARSQSQAPQENQRLNISFFNGAYRKYSTRLGNMSYILKVQQKEYPELPATEFLCNQIFESLKIPIPDYYLVRFPEDQFCFVTKNFMSELTGSNLVHLYHLIESKMEYDCQNLVTIIGKQTGKRAEQERFVYLTLADSLTGNHDRHGRNLGFIQSAKEMVLAPFYDNPSALALEEHSILGADFQPRGAIFTKNSDKPTIKDYVREWNRLGYGDVIDCFRKQLSLEKIKILIKKSYISEKRQKALLRLITNRSEELCKT